MKIRLFLDDVRNPPDDGGGPWTICRTAEEAKALLDDPSVEVEEASLDHDLGECDECSNSFPHAGQIVTSTCRHHMTGYDLVKWMAEHDVWPRSKPRVHSQNPVGAANMRGAIERYWTPRT